MHNRNCLMLLVISATLSMLAACGGGGSSLGSTNNNSGVADSGPPSACNEPANEVSHAGKIYNLALDLALCANVYFESGNTTLANDQNAILADISAALTKINQKLSINNFTLLVNSDNAVIDPIRGTGGAAYATKSVEMGIDYTVATTENITYIIAREAHRSRRIQNNALNDTLLAALVTEGLAIAFAIEMAELQVLPPETVAIAAPDYNAVVTAALAELNSQTYDADEWFFGNGALAQFTGHSLGYDTVQRFLSRHPGSAAAYAFAVDVELFADYVELINPADPIQVLKATQSLRTPDLPGLPPELQQVKAAVFADQSNRLRGDYFLEGLTNRKTVALTFDDGPSFYSRSFLDVLAANNVKATFFLIGSNLQQTPQVAIEAMQEGHTLANHTLSHNHNSDRDPEELWQNSLNSTNDIFESILGIRPRLFRPSYGEISDAQVTFLSNKNMKSILWSIDTRDWYTAAVDTAAIIAAANNHMHEEAIILMHDGGGNRQNTLNAVQSIIDHYRANGYEFVTVDQMLGVSKFL